MREGTYQIQVKQIGDTYVATGCVRAGDFEVMARAKISAKAIQRLLHRAMKGWAGRVGGYDEDEIGAWGFFKSIYKGIKKVVKTVKKVAKKIAQSKVLRSIAKTFRNPAFMAALSVIPGIGTAAAAGLAAAGAAYGGLSAMAAKKRGKGRTARRISLKSAKRAKRFGLSAKRFNAAQRYGASLAVDKNILKKLIALLKKRIAQREKAKRLISLRKAHNLRKRQRAVRRRRAKMLRLQAWNRAKRRRQQLFLSRLKRAA